MDIKQISGAVNSIMTEELGDTATLLQEDLSNFVDVGKAVTNAIGVEPFTGKLIDRVNRIDFDNREYRGSAPDIFMTNWEYGSAIEVAEAEVIDAVNSPTWALVNNTTINQDVFTQPQIESKIYNKIEVLEYDLSKPMVQVNSALNGPQEFLNFMAFLESIVRKSMRAQSDAIVMRTINNYIAESVYLGKNIKMLALYNLLFTPTPTKAEALYSKDFWRFFAKTWSNYHKYIQRMSKLNTPTGFANFANKEDVKGIMLQDCASIASYYLDADTFHKELVEIQGAETVPYWQMSGQAGYAFDDISAIDVKLASDNTKTVQQSDIIGILYDRFAIGANHYNSRVRTHVNDKGEFLNSFYKVDMGYFNNLNKCGVVFTLD